jgi:flavin reductase (DIM6/NTAB) family NADH-FMN oxidoreductase RutF
MDSDARKTALRMIPYGLHVLTSENDSGTVSAATVNWVTQASFSPPMVAVAVKVDSRIHNVIKESEAFALNILGKGQNSMAFAFFKPVDREGNTVAGEPFQAGESGSPILENSTAFLDCNLVGTLEKGDHSIFLGEVVDAGVRKELEGRPEETTLMLKDLGDKIFYGG